MPRPAPVTSAVFPARRTAHRVTAPRDADATLRAYFASTPRCTRGSATATRQVALGELAVGEVDLEPSRVDVDRHDVAVAQEPDRPAARRLGRDVPDHQPARRAAEAAVGDERDRVAEPAADDRRGDRQHLGHAGRAGRPFAADDDDLAGLHDAVVDRSLALGLRLEDPRRPAVDGPLVAGELHDRAVRREVAAEDAQRAARLERLRDRRDHLAVGLGGRRRDARRSCVRRPSARRCRRCSCSCFITAAVPPTRCRSPATKRPPGVRLVTTGVDAERRSKSSSSSGTPASSAIASRCSTEFVEPPVPGDADDRVADAPRAVTNDDGRASRAITSRIRRPACSAAAGFAGSVAVIAAEPDRPEPEEVDRDGHRVGGEVAGARADAGARVALELGELVVDELAAPRARRPLPRRSGSSRACRDASRPPSRPSRGSAPARRAARAPSPLPAPSCRSPTMQISPSKGWLRRDELDRVGDHLAADERRAHRRHALRLVVGDGDRVELHRRAAGGADAGRDVLARGRAGRGCTASSPSRSSRSRRAACPGRARPSPIALEVRPAPPRGADRRGDPRSRVSAPRSRV